MGVLLALTIAGCAAVTPPTGGRPESVSGRLAVRVEALDAQPAQQWSSAFDLRGDARQGELQLTSPIGTTIAQARWSPGHAELVTPQASTQHVDLDALARAMLGIEVPMAAMLDWLAGRRWPGAPATDTPVGFEQLGWAVDLLRRAEGRLTIRRAEAPAVTVLVQLDAAT